MHVVIANAVCPFAEQIAEATLIEAQVSPDPEFHRWSGQQVVEHLILSFARSREELRNRLKRKEPPSRAHSWLQSLLPDPGLLLRRHV